jgi:electron transport complex protein RnfD
METQLLVGSSPHLRDADSIRKIMWSVVMALLPAAALSVYFFGAGVLSVYAISIASAEATELLWLRVRGKPLHHAADGSAFVTGMLLAMVLPPGVAYYCPLVGGAFAIAVAKQPFGGLGSNIWNPALAARVFLQFAYPKQISLASWTVPRLLWGTVVHAETMASPLAKEGVGAPLSHLDLLFGNGVPGCIGETCKVALIAGGVFLIVRRIVDWRIPLCYLGTVFVLAWALPVGENVPAWARAMASPGGSPDAWVRDPLFHVLSGGLVIGAFFMATDMVTTPITRAGRAVFAVGCGLLVTVIRRYGGYPEGVAYSIVIMNTCVPLIDRWIRPRVYGSRTPKPVPRQA